MSEEGRCCAACGKSSPNLRKCAPCKSVWYCDVSCQRDHRKAHKKECRVREQVLLARKKAKAGGNTNAEVLDLGGGIMGMKVSSTRTITKRYVPSGAERSGSSPASGVQGGGMEVNHFAWVNQSGETNAGASSNKRDEDDMFAPPPPKPDCPVCCVSLPLLNEETVYKECCGHFICRGCIYENKIAFHKRNEIRVDKKLKPLEENCPYCRTEAFDSDREYIERLTKRVELDDAVAIYNLAGAYREGTKGLPVDMRKAFELMERSAELDYADALYNLSIHYRMGAGVRADAEKARHYLVLAAKKGELMARHNLGCEAEEEGDYDLAFRHWFMAAAAGGDGALMAIKKGFMSGIICKDDYAKALRAHQKARNDTWSEEREKHKRTDIDGYNSVGSY